MKRILQVALVLVLALGVFSVRGGVLAETTVDSLESLTQAFSNATSGDTIKLMADISTNSPLTIQNKDLTIDLNGHTLTGQDGIECTTENKVTTHHAVINIDKGNISIVGKGKIVSKKGDCLYASNGSTLTLNAGVVIGGYHFGVRTEGSSFYLKGAEIIGGNRGAYVKDGTFIMESGSLSGDYAGIYLVASNKKTDGLINGGTISGTNPNEAYGIVVAPTEPYKVNLEITGGTITCKAKEGSALSGNGTWNGTNIDITGGQLNAVDLAIYHPQRGTINIRGTARITGGNTGIEIRSGTLNVAGDAQIIGGSNGETQSDPNGNGSTTVNAAIAVAQHTTKNDISVNITGGTMKATSALFVSNPQKNGDASSVKVTISDGATSVPRLAGAIGVTDNRVPKFFISGGLFSKEVNKDYINKDFVSLSTGDSSYPYRVGKYVTPEDKPLPDAPAPMPNEVKDVTAKANTEAAQQGMNVKADSDDIKNVGNNDLKEDEKASGAWIWLTVEPNKVENEKDRTPIQNTLKGTSQIGVWMNISLFKQVVGEAQSKIPETQSPIELSIQLDSKLLMPKEKQNTHRYVVYRYHGGKVERLDTKFDAKTNTLTFSTDKFSTYALVYEEIPVEPQVTPQPEVTPVPVAPDMPQTGDGSQLVLFVALLGVSVMGLLLLAKRRRA